MIKTREEERSKDLHHHEGVEALDRVEQGLDHVRPLARLDLVLACPQERRILSNLFFLVIMVAAVEDFLF